MPTDDKAILQEARRVTRLETARKRLRAELREVEGELKLARKNLRALTKVWDRDRDPFDTQLPPIRGLDS